MYLAVDVGGSKTLAACFSAKGLLLNKEKFPTPARYHDFILQLDQLVKKFRASEDFLGACCALPALEIDRKKGIGKQFGNLPWKNVPVKDSLKTMLGHNTPVFVENDAKLAGLSEALLILNRYKKVLYLTVSTGIGGSVITNGIIDNDFQDMEPGRMIFKHNGKLQMWEDFASGKALKERYGKLASEIEDENIWQTFSNDLALGIYELIPVIKPDVVIIGGGVGAHFDKFGSFLRSVMNNFKSTMVVIPPIIQAHRPEEAVVYGCYEFIKQNS